ncbi:MAG TPA: hypothetical protein VI815_02795 [Candidatus Nanoarchaeia archaeon]|nr:hypothetical protein [Candidatus Nanoarchaeia archaeon]
MRNNVQIISEYKLKSNSIRKGFYLSQVLITWLILDKFNPSTVISTIYYVLVALFLVIRLVYITQIEKEMSLESLVYGILKNVSDNKSIKSINDIINKN